MIPFSIKPQLAGLAAAIVYIIYSTGAFAEAGGHQELIGPFVNAQNVVVQCLKCHPKEGEDILQSSHWTWQRKRVIAGEEKLYSKKTGLSTFAIQAGANPEQCLTCHISTNLLNERFDPTSAIHIDCLVCHDTTGRYQRNLGAPKEGLDLAAIARRVGRPTARNCSVCHGQECGLTGRRLHGTITSDIHFKQDGAALTCQNCHDFGNQHAFSRQVYANPVFKNQPGCQACHQGKAHVQDQLNEHAEKISCQTCHIPNYANTTPAMVNWNWYANANTPIFINSDSKRKPLINANGITLATNIEPVYFWDNGEDVLYQRGGKIDPSSTTMLQGPTTRTPRSKITPFSTTYGTQIYDAKYRYLISPKLTSDPLQLFPVDDWKITAEQGMLSLRLPFSGSIHSTQTVTYRRLNHGVLAAAQSLDCMDCHGKSGRMDWPSLGYEQDPWAGEAGHARSTGTPAMQDQQPSADEMEPVSETVLPMDDTVR